MEFFVKDVPTLFVILDGKQIKVNDIRNTLDQFATEDDAINSYNLESIAAADVLVTEGILESYIGSRMAHLYKKTDKFDQYYADFTSYYYKYIEENRA